MDANFRLKLKRRGINDPEVGSGWSYFVESAAYGEHISRATVEKEVSLFELSFGHFPDVLQGCWLRFRFPRCKSG